MLACFYLQLRQINNHRAVYFNNVLKGLRARVLYLKSFFTILVIILVELERIRTSSLRFALLLLLSLITNYLVLQGNVC